jgi:hypothetical protein
MSVKFTSMVKRQRKIFTFTTTVILQVTVLKAQVSKLNFIVRETGKPGDCEEREKLADLTLKTACTS